MLRFASQKRNIRVTLRDKRNISPAENVTLQNGKVIGSYNLLYVTRNATSGTGIKGATRRTQRNGRNWLQKFEAKKSPSEEGPLVGAGWLGQAGSECRQKIHRHLDRFDVGLVSGDDLLFHRLAHWDQFLAKGLSFALGIAWLGLPLFQCLV